MGSTGPRRSSKGRRQGAVSPPGRRAQHELAISSSLTAQQPAPPHTAAREHDSAQPALEISHATAAPEAPQASEIDEMDDLGASVTELEEREPRPAFLQSAWQRIRALTVEQWLWIGVLVLASVLRFWGMGDKPLHHDESMHAYYSLIFARDPSSYAYDPLLHGPFQFHAEGFMFAIIQLVEHLFRVSSSAGDPWINDATARIVPVLFGIGIVALPIGLRRELGRAGALIAAFLLAVSPAFVYFSRFLREDIYFNFFMFAMVVCAVRFFQSRGTGWFVAMFASAVLAYATFEGIFLTLTIFAGFLALLAVWDLASGLARVLPKTLTERERTFFSRTLSLLALATVGGATALIALGKLHDLNLYVTTHADESLAQVQQLENISVAVLLYASILIALLVITVLLWQLGHESPAVTYTRGGLADGLAEDLPAPVRPPLVERMVTAPARGLAHLRARLDPDQQPFLYMVLGISWVQWFVAFVVSWVIFAGLYWIIPGNSRPTMTLGQGFTQGVGTGIWQGLYYWLTQQEVARGGQPWYYYLLLLPLYEQLVIVFGLAGIIYAIRRPTRFRLFLVWWFVASLGLYSWAGEKMPWLTIHMLLPLFLLAALMLEWCLRQAVAFAPRLLPGHQEAVSPDTLGVVEDTPPIPAVAGRGSTFLQRVRASERLAFLQRLRIGARGATLFGRLRTGVLEPVDAPPGYPATLATMPYAAVSAQSARRRGIAGLVGLGIAVLLLIPMVHSMLVLTHQDAAKGPLEMMVYVQTTDDVDLVMNKIAIADQKLYGGQHELRIGVGTGEEWPMYWYLRDYYLTPHPTATSQTYVTWAYDASKADAPQEDVLILLPTDAQVFMAQHPTGYHMKQYKLRSWFDEAYKPPPCTPSKGHACPSSANWGSGVGVGNFLSYGDNPPPNAKFNLGRAASRLWAWLWVRQPLGDTHGSYDFTFIVRDGVPIQP